MSSSSQQRCASIEAWFRAHEDGEFVVLPEEHPSTAVGDSSQARTVVYTTKPHGVARVVDRFAWPTPLAVIGRAGFPCHADLQLLRTASSQATCLFVGDADPPDLLIYAWLNEHRPLRWCGVSDVILAGRDDRQLTAITLPLSKAEELAMISLRTLCPGYRELLGPRCSSILDAGGKIELEGATWD